MPRDPSRRRFLQTLCGGLVVAGVASLLPRDGLAADISLADRIDLLYSNQFHFDPQGRPRIAIGVIQGRKEVALSAKGGLSALPSGDGGTAIAGGGHWRIRVADGQPAQQRFRLVLDALQAGELRRVASESERWRKRGFTIDEREVGSLFGVAGTVLDTRKILLTTGEFSSEREADEAARELADRWGILPRLHPEVDRRASGKLIAEDLETGIEIRAEGVLWFAPRSAATIGVHDVQTDAGLARRDYRGQIYVTIDRHGKLAVVNQVGESDVLAGLVPAEIYASAPMEALKAQAIAARGQLLAKIGSRHLDDPFLLCAHEHCQVYAGTSREHERTSAAVERTIGRVLMRPNETELVDTVYSANCGGHSEDNEQVWPSPADPQLRGQADPKLGEKFAKGIDEHNIAAWLRDNPDSYSRPSGKLSTSYRWTTTVDPAGIAGNPHVPDDLGKLVSIRIAARGRSGRATEVELLGADSSTTIHGELKIRQALGGLKSSAFLVDADRDERGHFVLRGAGHGHGVGLCQHGAIGMAEAGKTYGPILAHYYQGAKLVRLW
ncbi:SpoIID/LytB domain-containing protein [Nannocystaceae bacterium ST9]